MFYWPQYDVPGRPWWSPGWNPSPMLEQAEKIGSRTFDDYPYPEDLSRIYELRFHSHVVEPNSAPFYADGRGV